ncbi:hypothetical protein NIES2134_109430 [Thermostichus vulcanus NIES-2134]|nr:hypothetical protein NIES2134_109430 [Thermostichus vulcanus NIES-2134]
MHKGYLTPIHLNHIGPVAAFVHKGNVAGTEQPLPCKLHNPPFAPTNDAGGFHALPDQCERLINGQGMLQAMCAGLQVEGGAG